MSTPPVLVLGMHRSGTTVVAQVLSSLGVFMGADLQGDHESRFFRAANDWLLRQAGAAWDHPEPLRLYRERPEVLALTTRYLDRMLGSARMRTYSGVRRTGTDSGGLLSSWGWKDPRNTFTIDVWGRLFPEARLIGISRDGLDVAASLRRRAQEQLATWPWRLDAGGRSALRMQFAWRRFGFTGSMRALSIPDGIDLWGEYERQLRSVMDSAGERALHLRYEDLVDAPSEGVVAIAQHVGAATSDRVARSATSLVARGQGASRDVDGSNLDDRRRALLERYGHAPRETK